MSYHWHDDAPEVVMLGDTRQRARKEHRCDACPLSGAPSSAVIPVGQEYRRITGTQDGEFFTSRACVGRCPHTTDCPSCRGTAVIGGEGIHSHPCPACDGYGRVRAALTASEEKGS